jgi:hypothetical protein
MRRVVLVVKVSHHFRLDEKRADELTRLAKFYTIAQKQDGFLPHKKMTKTDIVEWLIQEKFEEMKEGGFEI